MRGPVGIVDVRRRLGEAGDVVIGGGWGGGGGRWAGGAGRLATSSLMAGYHGNQLRNDWLSRPFARVDLIYDDVPLVINVCILIIYIYISYIIL